MQIWNILQLFCMSHDLPVDLRYSLLIITLFSLGSHHERYNEVAVYLNFFCYLLQLRHYKRKSVEVGVSWREWVTLSADFRGREPINHCWCQSSRMIALSCGIKISAVHHLDLSQSTHVTDRWTDRWTDRITTPKTALTYACTVKSVS